MIILPAMETVGQSAAGQSAVGQSAVSQSAVGQSDCRPGRRADGGDTVRGVLLAAFTLIMILLSGSCNVPVQQAGGRRVTDGAGRVVTIPDTVRSVIALRSGMMRLLSYMEVTHLVTHVEGNEQRRNVPYLFANPHLKELPVIGAGNHYDTELLAAAAPDLVVATYMAPREADRLQRLIQRPVLLLNYGDMGDGREQLYETLTLLGTIFHREERAERLTVFMEESIASICRRAATDGEEQRAAYIGGVAYNGAHGLTSTEPAYPPFVWLGIANVAEGLSLRGGGETRPGEVLFIDPEQIMEWDPATIFLDAAGRSIWERELERQSAYGLLKACREKQLYIVLPYNWNSINYENLFCNAWYIGSLMMPSAFGEAEYEERCREVFLTFYGRDLYDQVADYYQPFRRYDMERYE